MFFNIEAWLKLNIRFDYRYLVFNLVFIVLNVRGGIESNYPSIVFLSL